MHVLPPWVLSWDGRFASKGKLCLLGFIHSFILHSQGNGVALWLGPELGRLTGVWDSQLHLPVALLGASFQAPDSVLLPIVFDAVETCCFAAETEATSHPGCANIPYFQEKTFLGRKSSHRPCLEMQVCLEDKSGQCGLGSWWPALCPTPVRQLFPQRTRMRQKHANQDTIYHYKRGTVRAYLPPNHMGNC